VAQLFGDVRRRETRMIDMEINTRTENGVAVLLVSGRIDTSTAPDLERELNRLIDTGTRRILLNFQNAVYISSGGLRVLLSTAKKLSAPGDRFALCSLTAEVNKIMKLAGFTTIFRIYPGEGDALAGW
jgi:anti-sigma B factor antagonist